MDGKEKLLIIAAKAAKEILPYIAVLGIAFLINRTILVNARIPSESMEPTLMIGERLFAYRLAYNDERKPQRYDIVIFNAPDEEGELYVKRIVGMPGDVIDVVDGVTYINGTKDEYSGNSSETDDGDGHFEVPEGCYFLQGDNRDNSYDSRYWDDPYIPEKEIVAKAGLRYWPFTKIGFVE